MKKHNETSAEVIEAEVLDEHGLPIKQEGQTREHININHAQAGFFAGFVALAFSFIMILVTAAVTVFIILPLMLLGRLLGLQIKTLRR